MKWFKKTPEEYVISEYIVGQHRKDILRLERREQ